MNLRGHFSLLCSNINSNMGMQKAGVIVEFGEVAPKKRQNATTRFLSNTSLQRGVSNLYYSPTGALEYFLLIPGLMKKDTKTGSPKETATIPEHAHRARWKKFIPMDALPTNPFPQFYCRPNCSQGHVTIESTGATVE